MRVLFVAAEAFPLAKTGGLGDVARALPSALASQGVDVRLLLPGYPSALAGLVGARVEATLDEALGAPDARLISGRLPDSGVPTWLIDAPSLFRRGGGPYVDEEGCEWPDNARRFAYLSAVAAEIAMGRIAAWKADVAHANDWHTGLLPLLLAQERCAAPATVFTIHNMAFQGNFPLATVRALGAPDHCLDADGCEFYGQASFLKAGIRYADKVTTVSPTYATEILTPEFGHGLDGLLRARRDDLSGILNGVEANLWDPATDIHLPARFSRANIAGKRVCKAVAQAELGLPVDPETPLIGFASRLAHQKMADLLPDAAAWFAQNGAQLAVVAQGDPELEARLAEAAARFPEHVAARVDYREAVAHRLYAGADMLLAPARFEPCGLTQLYAMGYGTVPIVRRVGGLADTVIDANQRAMADRTATGFAFRSADLASMTCAIGRAVELYRQPLAWRRLQLQGMSRDFGWGASARAYLDLYRCAVGVEEPVGPDGGADGGGMSDDVGAGPGFVPAATVAGA